MGAIPSSSGISQIYNREIKIYNIAMPSSAQRYQTGPTSRKNKIRYTQTNLVNVLSSIDTGSGVVNLTTNALARKFTVTSHDLLILIHVSHSLSDVTQCDKLSSKSIDPRPRR